MKSYTAAVTRNGGISRQFAWIRWLESLVIHLRAMGDGAWVSQADRKEQGGISLQGGQELRQELGHEPPSTTKYSTFSAYSTCSIKLHGARLGLGNPNPTTAFQARAKLSTPLTQGCSTSPNQTLDLNTNHNPNRAATFSVLSYFVFSLSCAHHTMPCLATHLPTTRSLLSPATVLSAVCCTPACLPVCLLPLSIMSATNGIGDKRYWRWHAASCSSRHLPHRRWCSS